MMYNPIQIQITPQMLQSSKLRDCGQMNSQSFMKGKGNIVGFLGEEMVLSLSKDFSLVDSYDYDFLFKDRYKIDVKTKYQTMSFAPKPNYEASVARDCLHQRTDYYVFCRVYRDKNGEYPYGWILGFISKKRYFENSKKLLKGDLDPSNNFTVREECHNLPYSELFEMEKLLSL